VATFASEGGENPSRKSRFSPEPTLWRNDVQDAADERRPAARPSPNIRQKFVALPSEQPLRTPSYLWKSVQPVDLLPARIDTEKRGASAPSWEKASS